jgi:uncharacterized protein
VLEWPRYDIKDACRLTPGTRLELILKVTERCNIACDYCYFFYAGNESHAIHPSIMHRDVFEGVIRFIDDAVETLGVESVQIDFHGGEPLLLKPAYFDWMCSTIRDRYAHGPEVTFAIQTNGILVNDIWIDLFGRHNVHVGVSIDGPAAYHDRHRIDHKGRPTHAQVVRGIKMMKQAHSDGRMGDIAALCVVEEDVDIAAVYEHLVGELGIRSLNFLFPEIKGSTFNRRVPARMVSVFDKLTQLWLQDRSVNLSLLRHPYGRMNTPGPYDEDVALHQFMKSMVYTVYSNGEIGPDDTLRPLAPELFETGLNVTKNSIIEVIEHPAMRAYALESFNLPTECTDCCWRNVCRAGELSHRHSPEKRFANPSTYCDALAEMYATLAADAINRGISMSSLAARLGLSPEELSGEHDAVSAVA